ncbi:hypothetical protein [Curtobacterium pusillum]|uniref:hypothetical protein n=1 Tax=Curtobacterium pusillum TaxID=69373 RepID=UPI0011A0D000|nr:hypothetical protein [Curtobacterium pusillum]
MAEFLSLFPASASTQRLRRQVIRLAQTAAALPDPAPEPDQQRVWQYRDSQPTVEDVLAALPKYRFPGVMRGRRDAFLVVLLGTLGMPRTEARRLRPAAITLGATITINGRAIPTSADPVRCAACAVTRWLRIVGPTWIGLRGDVRQLLDPTTSTLNTHDCERPVPGDWRRAEQQLLPLEVHGWARTGVALSGRSMTAIVPRRRAAAAADQPPEVIGPVARPRSRFDALTLQETYDELGDTDAAVDAALARLQAISDDVRALGDVLDDVAAQHRPSRDRVTCGRRYRAQSQASPRSRRTPDSHG